MKTATLDLNKQQAFGERLIQQVNQAALALMMSIGHRTRLFDVMATLPPSTCEEIAAAAKLHPRYVREWLGAMTTGGVVEHDPPTMTFHLPPEHAAWLTRAASPNNVACSMQWMGVLGAVEDLVVDAFAHGRGVPYSAYKRFNEVMAEESSQTVVAALLDHILPLVPGLTAKLDAGIDVLDVGCGSGMAMNYLAAHFPRSRFAGYDLLPDAIARAQAGADARNLKNVRFQVVDAPSIAESQTFDLITAFDAIHDQARPDLVLANIRRALRPGGLFLMQDIRGSSHVHCNHDTPLATFGYTVSCMHCMSVSLAGGGMGLGAMWGKEKALEMLDAAGFKSVRVETLEHDIINYYYIAQ